MSLVLWIQKNACGKLASAAGSCTLSAGIEPRAAKAGGRLGRKPDTLIGPPSRLSTAIPNVPVSIELSSSEALLDHHAYATVAATAITRTTAKTMRSFLCFIGTPLQCQ